MSADGTNETVKSDLDAQIAECSEAISRNPRDGKAHRQRGLLKARMHRYEEALHDFERTLKLTPNDAHAYGLRGLVWAKKGDRSRALADFDEAIRLAPQNSELYRSHRDRVLPSPRAPLPLKAATSASLMNPSCCLDCHRRQRQQWSKRRMKMRLRMRSTMSTS